MADPTVGDVFDQLVFVNSKLDQIQTNTLPIVASVNHLDGHVVSGFNATAVALTTIAQINTEAAKLLFHLTQQTDAMICILEHISKNTCGILTQVTLQTEIQTRISDDTAVLREIAESSHPEAELNRQRLEKLRMQIEQCCPPKRPAPACTYAPCPAPPPIKEQPTLPKVPDVPKQDTPPGSVNKAREQIVNEIVGQLEPHLPIKSFETIQRSLPNVVVDGQHVPMQILAPHVVDGLFPIETKEDLVRKVNAGVGLARAMVESLPVDSIDSALLPAVVTVLQRLGPDPIPRGPLGQQREQKPIFGSPVEKEAD